MTNLIIPDEPGQSHGRYAARPLHCPLTLPECLTQPAGADNVVGAARPFPIYMKTALFLCATLLRAGAGLAQQITPDLVPPLAFVALQEQYPLAAHVRWAKTHGLSEARFTIGQAPQAIRFGSGGDVEARVADLDTSALPSPVRRRLAIRYSDLTFCKATRVENIKSGAVTYEAEACGSDNPDVITFTADGREVRRPRPRPRHLVPAGN